MPRRSAKTRGGKKDFASKNTMNPPSGADQAPESTQQPDDQDPKRRIGQYGGKGEPPIMKR
jgi:hypothetical protein